MSWKEIAEVLDLEEQVGIYWRTLDEPPSEEQQAAALKVLGTLLEEDDSSIILERLLAQA